MIGSPAEGETVTLLGGVAAHQGLLKFPLVVLSVALGGMIGDQCSICAGGGLAASCYAVSKHQDKIERAQKLIQRHPYLFVIGTRFMYGFRGLARRDWCQPAAAENLSAAEYSRRICPGVDFYHYWLRWWSGGLRRGCTTLDQHLKHWVWLILVVVLVVGVRWWLKRRGKKKPDHQA